MIVDTAKMSERGQIVIPKEIRDQLGATDNTLFTLYAPGDGTLVLRKFDRDAAVKEFRKLRAKTDKVDEQFVLDEIQAARKEARRPGHERADFSRALAERVASGSIPPPPRRKH